MRINRPRLLNILVLAVFLLGALPAPVAAEPPPAESAAQPQGCNPVSGVRITGPTAGRNNAPYTFTATVSTANGEAPQHPFDYQWEFTQQGTITGTSMTEDSFSVTKTWDVDGLKLITVTVFSCAPSVVTVTRTVEFLVGDLPLDDVPEDVRQRALLFLEEQRGSGQSPEWASAYLGAGTPLFRPDMTYPAYYEFEVLDGSNPAGFMVLSTGTHDHPITNWATAGLPPTRRMRLAAGEENRPARYYKLDILSYVAEDNDGQMVARSGELPAKVTGMPAEWLTNPPPVVETTAFVPQMLDDTPDDDLLGDPLTGGITHTVSVSVTNPVTYELQFEAWASWAALKRGYRTAYRPFLDAMRRAAAPAWQIETHAAQYGHVLFKGDTLEHPLAFANPEYVLDGPGAALVQAGVISDDGVTPQLAITATADIPGQSVPLTATITYGSGLSETLNILVAHQYVLGIPLTSVYDTGPEFMAGLAAAGITLAAPEAAGIDDAELQEDAPGTLAEDGYTYWYASALSKAEADQQQAWYEQYKNEEQDCHTGCGATAWAMLIAWGDKRAAREFPRGGSAMWEGRWGLYRQNGGYGADAVAPTWADAGVEHITWELADYLDTWCNPFNDNGATWPSDMDDVVGYLNGRSGVNVRTWYLPAGFDVSGYAEQDIESKARNIIQNPMDKRRPVVIGIGFFSHYPLAYGYRWKQGRICSTHCDWQGCKTNCLPTLLHGFYVNEGWAQGAGEWVASDLFFSGKLLPQSSFADDVGIYLPANQKLYYDYQHDAVHDTSHISFGWPKNIRPLVGDFNRDGVLDDIAGYVFNHDDVGIKWDWYFDYNNDSTTDVVLNRWMYNETAWPIALDARPEPDGFVDDIAVYIGAIHEFSWNIDHADDSISGSQYASWYPADGLPVSGDFDRDGLHDDVALFSPSTGMWVYDYNLDGIQDGTSGPWGTPSDYPFALDYDGDGFVDDLGLYNSRGDYKWRYDTNHDANSSYGSAWTSPPYGAKFALPFAGNFNTW